MILTNVEIVIAIAFVLCFVAGAWVLREYPKQA
jgi:hypothetical protein